MEMPSRCGVVGESAFHADAEPRLADALTIGEPVFFDLRDPWLHAPS